MPTGSVGLAVIRACNVNARGGEEVVMSRYEHLALGRKHGEFLGKAFTATNCYLVLLVLCYIQLN